MSFLVELVEDNVAIGSLVMGTVPRAGEVVSMRASFSSYVDYYMVTQVEWKTLVLQGDPSYAGVRVHLELKE